MNRNSYDFSLAETSSLAQIDPDQNPSWINLKSLKDIIHQSTTERSGNNSKSNSNYNSRSLLPPQQQCSSTYKNRANNKENNVRANHSSQLNQENKNVNGKSLLDTKKYNFRGSSSSRALYNPKEMLSFDVQNSQDDSQNNQFNTFTTNADQTDISNQQNAQAILKRLSNWIEPIDTQINYYSNDDSQTQQQQTMIMNHIDTPQSILMPEMRGHEIESLLKDEIAHLLNSDKTNSNNTPNIYSKDQQYENQVSPYGKTQEFDIHNLQSEECLNYIQSITQYQEDNTDINTEVCQITHRVQYNEKHIISNNNDISITNDDDLYSQQDSQRSHSANNQFKRQKNQPSQARDSITIRQSVDIKQVGISLENQNLKSNNKVESGKGQIIQHVKKTSQLIDLTKRSFDNFQPQKQVVINLFENQEDKENQNPYQTHSDSLTNKQKLDDYQESQKLRIVDKDFDQFCDQIEKMRSKQIPEITVANSNDVSIKRRNQNKSVDRVVQQQTQETPQKLTSHQSFELSESQSIKSPLSPSQQNILVDNNESKDNTNFQQQSPAPQIDSTMQQSFKRSRPNKHLRFIKQNDSQINYQQKQLHNNSNSIVVNQHQQVFDVSQIEQQSSLDMSMQSMTLAQNVIQDEMQEIQQRQRLELLALKKENIKLQRQNDQQTKEHTLAIEQLKKDHQLQQQLKIKELDDDYQIIIEGMKQEHEDRINELKFEYMQKIDSLNEEHQREILHKQTKIEKKREKLYKIRDQFDGKRKEYNALVIELEAYKSKVEEMTQYQLQNNVNTNSQNNRDSMGNVFMTSQSCDNLRMLNQNKNQGYFTSRDETNPVDLNNDLNHFCNSDHKQPNPYQSFDNFLDIKKRAEGNNNYLDIPQIINTHNNNQQYNSNNSLGLQPGVLVTNNNNQQDDSKHINMNFYFSLSQIQHQHQQEDSAMNFSFSEVKTSFDNKSVLFYGDNKNQNNIAADINSNPLLICHTDSSIGRGAGGAHNKNKFSILDTINQNSDEDDDGTPHHNNNGKDMLFNNDKHKKNKMSKTQQSLEDYDDHIQSHSQPHYESDSDNNDIKKYLDSSSAAQTDSIKTASLNQQSINNQTLQQPNHNRQSSRIDHVDVEPTSENYLDDEEGDDLEDEEESKSNLSYKIDDMTTTNSQRQGGGAHIMMNTGDATTIINNNVIYQLDNDEEDEDDDMSGDNSKRTFNEQQQQQLLEGSENAPEDSGFLSDDADQERIVNESSLYNEDDFYQSQNLLACTVSADPYLLYSDAFEEDSNLIMTGRSESAMDDDDNEIEGISKCKAINSSYINLKRNNLLIGYGHK